ncbi:MAG: hypothetical protein HWE27_13700 [Gammaproteobacteria bacterium]|nr:hypothetical protein [Gammaproteobacteria bacterium]
MSQFRKLTAYYYTAIASVIIAVATFTYNTWRLEVTESNNNIRTASFRILTELAELEQHIYIAHYDQNPNEGSPRVGWVKVGLIHDLSSLVNKDVYNKTLELKNYWAAHWQKVSDDRGSVDNMVTHIDRVRATVTATLQSLD